MTLETDRNSRLPKPDEIPVTPGIVEEPASAALSVISPSLSGDKDRSSGSRRSRLPEGRQISQATFSTLQVVKEIARQALATDEQTRDLVKAALQERLEADYLAHMSENDRSRVYALRQQVIQANDILSGILGTRTTLPALYNRYSKEDSENYPSLDSSRGLTIFFTKFYPEIIIPLLSASVITSELAEIREQRELISARTNLQLLKIQKDSEEATKFNETADALKREAENRGEIRASRVKGFIKMTFGVLPDFFGTLATIPLRTIETPSNEFGKWIKENPGVAVPATIGGITTASTVGYILATSEFTKVWVATSALAFPEMIGMVIAGGVGGVVAGVALTNIGEVLVTKAKEFVEERRNR